MKKILLILLALSFSAFAGPDIVVNPNTTPSKRVYCNPPTEYTDNTPIQDPVVIRFFAGETATGPWFEIGSSETCSFVVNTADLPEGMYYYTLTANVNGMSSERWLPPVSFNIRIDREPKPVTDVSVE